MDMILLPVELHQFRFKIAADLGKYLPQPIQMPALKHFAPALADEDQMDVERVDRVTTMF